MAAEEEARRAAEELKRKEEELAALKEAEEAEARSIAEENRRQPRKHCEKPPRDLLDGRNARKRKGGSRQRYPPRKLLRRLAWLLRRNRAAQANDKKSQEEITRVAKDATVQGKRHVTNLRFRLGSVVATTTDMLQQNLAEQDRKRDRVLVSLQRAVEEYTRYHRAGTEALDRKFTDMLGAFAAEHNEKHQETDTTFQQSNVELVVVFHSEVAQVVDGNERTQCVLTEAGQNELGKFREKVAHLAVEVGTEFDQGRHYTTASVETLQEVGGEDLVASPRTGDGVRRSHPGDDGCLWCSEGVAGPGLRCGEHRHAASGGYSMLWTCASVS